MASPGWRGRRCRPARAPELLDTVVAGMSHASDLQAAAGLPADGAGQRVEAALGELDDIIRQVRGAAFAGRVQGRQLPLLVGLRHRGTEAALGQGLGPWRDVHGQCSGVTAFAGVAVSGQRGKTGPQALPFAAVRLLQTQARDPAITRTVT